MDSVKEIRRAARKVYTQAPVLVRVRQSLRSRICPYEAMLELVPKAARVLDVGCGAGLFLFLLAGMDRVSDGLGLDASASAIGCGREIAQKADFGGRLRFEEFDATGDWPAERFDVVSLIDLLHHIPRERQATVLISAAGCVQEGGILLYKDMTRRPRWKAAANRLHDLVLARQWVHYPAAEEVVRLVGQLGLVKEKSVLIDRLWYRHHLMVFRRRAPGD